MHVLILNQTFHPDTAATAQLMWDLARDLDAAGHRVSVVTSRVVYGGDRLHPFALQRYGHAINVRRVAGTRFGKSSRLGLLGRLSDFGSFYLAAARELTSVTPTPDVILALTSPPMVASLAVMLKAYRRALGARGPRVVYHVMDLYPEAAVASGVLRRGALPERVLSRLARRTLAGCDAVIALGRDMKARILAGVDGNALDPARVHVVPPWADAGELWPLGRRDNPLAASLGVADGFNLVYSGNFGVAHDADTLLGAIDRTRHEPGLRWLFVGDGQRLDALRADAARRGWPHVRVMPLRPREELNASLNLADVHLVSQLPAFTGLVVPSKLFGIMAVGRPTLMVGPADAECSRIVREHDAGVVVPNGDVDGLLAAIAALRHDDARRRRLGENARHALERHYSRTIATARIEAILRWTLSQG